MNFYRASGNIAEILNSEPANTRKVDISPVLEELERGKEDNVWILEQLADHIDTLEFPDMLEHELEQLRMLEGYNEDSVVLRPICWTSWPTETDKYDQRIRAVYGYAVLFHSDAVNGSRESVSEALYGLGVAVENKRDNSLQFKKFFTANQTGHLYWALSKERYHRAMVEAYRDVNDHWDKYFKASIGLSVHAMYTERFGIDSGRSYSKEVAIVREHDVKKRIAQEKMLKAIDSVDGTVTVGSVRDGEKLHQMLLGNSRLRDFIDTPAENVASRQELERCLDDHLERSRVVAAWRK